MKLFIYANSSASLQLLQKNIEKNGSQHDIECYYRELTPNGLADQTFLLDQDHYELETSDAIITWGTWGSSHSTRQWYPGNCYNSNNKQGYKDSVNRLATRLAAGYNIPHLVSETATLSRLRMNYLDARKLKSVNPVYYRLGRSHWTYKKATWPVIQKNKASKLEKFAEEFRSEYGFDLNFKNHKWRNQKKDHSKIFILPGLEHDPTSTEPPEQWVTKSIDKIRKITDRTIVVKPHPLTEIKYRKIINGYKNVDLLTEPTKIKNLAAKMYCAVVDNSTSVFELLDLGIPVFCSVENFAADFGNTNLDNIEKINYASKRKYHNWAQRMSCTEFSVHEWNSADIFEYIRYLVNAK